MITSTSNFFEIIVKQIFNQRRNITILIIIHSQLPILIITPPIDQSLILINRREQSIITRIHLKSLSKCIPRSSNYDGMVLTSWDWKYFEIEQLEDDCGLFDFFTLTWGVTKLAVVVFTERIDKAGLSLEDNVGGSADHLGDEVRLNGV